MSNELKKYEVLKPIGYGGRHEKGAILTMPVTDAEGIGAEYLKEVTSEGVAEKPTVSKKPVSKMSVAELRAYAGELGLDTEGSKADLAERITLHLKEE